MAKTRLFQRSPGADAAVGPNLGLWSWLPPTSKRMIALGGLLLLAMLAAVGVTLWDSARAALDVSQQNLSKLGIAIAEQTARSVQAVDVVLLDQRRIMAVEGIETRDQFRASLGTEAVHMQLRQRDEALPQANAFTVVDADGKLVNTSRRWPVPDIDLSDRPYFRYLSTHDDPGALLTTPIRSRLDGKWTIYIIRRVNSASGEFLGLVLGSLDLSYFQDFFKELTTGTGTSVSLRSRAGVTSVSYPPSTAIGETPTDPAGDPWYAFAAQPDGGNYLAKRRDGKAAMLVSVHPVADYGFVITLSVRVSEALARWRQLAWLSGVGTGCAVLCVLLLLYALGLQLRRLERSERLLRASQRRLAEESVAFTTTLDHMNQGVMLIEADRTVTVCNKRAIEMLELPASLIERRPSFDDVVQYQRSMGEFPATQTPSWLGHADISANPPLYERKRPNGRILEIQSVTLANGGMVRTYTDITERRRSEEQVRFFAHHDDMTKLVNRVVFQQRLAIAVEQADRTGKGMAVLYLDLDRFKLVNDTRGHAVGDKLLVQVAARVRGAVREEDTVARMGGDEFAIIQPMIEQPDASARLAARVLQVVSRPYEIEGSQCSIGVSIGIAHYPGHTTNAADLLRHADTALYHAKADGRGVFCIFEPGMDARHRERFQLEQELRQAVLEQQFEVEFQPVVSLASRRIIACEALLRWRHPERGLIGPDEFIGVAESCGLIVPIGRWILQAACAEAVTWPTDVAVSVNLSPMQFGQEEMVEELTAVAADAGFPLDRLILEVTEGLLLDESAPVLATMLRLRSLGVRFSLDDFGTAQAGLSYLRRFPFDGLKIDRSFVRDLTTQPEARAIVAAVLGIGEALGLIVVAEGVETEAQLQFLREFNCKHVQGYLTGRPVSAVTMRHNLVNSVGLVAQ